MIDRLRQRLSPIGNMYAKGEVSRADRFAARVRRPLDRMYARRVGALDGIDRLGASVAASAPPLTGPRVLFLSLRGWFDHTAYESVIAAALRMRGADVITLSCGGGQPICENGWARLAHPRPCDRCAWHADTAAAGLRLPHRRLGDEFAWGDDGSRAPVAPGPAHGIDPREASHISLAWLLRTSDATAHAENAGATRDFEVSAASVAAAADALLDELRPDVVFSLNGLFAAERVVRERALARGIRCPTYEIAPRAGTLVFSQDAPAPEYDNDAVWATVRDRPLASDQQAAIEELLADRARGVGAHERYFDAPEERLDTLRAQLGIPATGRVAGLFTNLSWDSATLDHDVAYSSMLDWIEASARAVDGLDDTTLIIRVHPAERRWGTRELVIPLLTERFGGRIPPNVKLVGPDEPLSTYALLDLSDLVLVYTTTVGLEAATRGQRVLVAGSTHYRGRGFTVDLETPADLPALLADPPGPLSAEEVELAHRYAFTFFFRCSIPFRPVRVIKGLVQEMPETAAGVARGADEHLDFIAERILDGGSFVLPDDRVLS